MHSICRYISTKEISFHQNTQPNQSSVCTKLESIYQHSKSTKVINKIINIRANKKANLNLNHTPDLSSKTKLTFLQT